MMSDENSLLEDMIHERDSQIVSLTNQLHQTSDSIHTLSKELHQKSIARKQQREEHSESIKKLKEEHLEQRQKLAKFEQNVKGGGGLRVHEYAALMRSANSNQVESSYVIRLQAQLCRAMHSLGVMESQLALVKENCSSLIRFMKEDLSRMVDDRTRREIELMNGLAKVDQEHRVLQNEMEKKINEKEELLESVREEYEELGLVYDEEEVKAALEVKYLLEQMEKIETEKERVEKEMLQALLDREKQIVALKAETEELGAKLETLQSNQKNDETVDDAKGGEQPTDGGNQEEVISGVTANDAQAEDKSTAHETSESKGEVEEADDTNVKEEAISNVTSQLEAAIIEDKADIIKEQVSAENDSVEKDEDDSDPVAANDVGHGSEDGKSDNGVSSEIEEKEKQEGEGCNHDSEEIQEQESIMDNTPQADDAGSGLQNEEADAEVATESVNSTSEHPPSDEIVEDENKPEPQESTSEIASQEDTEKE